MKNFVLAASLFASLALGSTAARADTVAYPSADNASFALDYPSSWEMEPGEEVGDYVTLSGPTGVVVQLRTIPGNEAALKEAIEQGADFLRETFSNVELEDPQDIEGDNPGFSVVGGGINDDGDAVGFAMFYVALPDGKIADIWYAVVHGDEKGGKEAEAVLDSFRTR